MKLMHLSDLHLGKRLIEVSMLEDQAHMLNQIVGIAREERPQAVLIAGDIYDRSNPPAEAMTLFARFLRDLTDLGCHVMAISGNHDSPERIAYLGELVSRQGVHLSPVYDGRLASVRLEDEFGPVCFWLMPFIHPDAVRPFFPDEAISSANDAVRLVLQEAEVDPSCRNVILSHQFIAGSTFDDRDQKAVGTLDNVDPSLYDAFDYAALGHIHRAQNVGRADGTMRYCGTMLKYSRAEASAEKTVTLVDLGPRGEVLASARPLRPLRELRAVRGTFEDLLSRGPEKGQEDDYYFITLTDEIDPQNAAARLRERYARLLSLDYDNSRTRAGAMLNLSETGSISRSPMDMLAELYQLTHGREMSAEALDFARRMIAETEGFEE